MLEYKKIVEKNFLILYNVFRLFSEKYLQKSWGRVAFPSFIWGVDL